MTTRAEDFPALRERLRAQCDAIVAQYEQPRSALLPLIHLFQQHEGYASPEAIRAVAERLNLTPAVVESTVSFYTLFFRRPVGKYVLQVCRGLACTINGAEDIMAYFREKLGIGHLQTTPDGIFSYEEVECLAACDRATCMQVNLDFVYDLTPQMIDELIAAMRAGTYAVAPMPQTEIPGPTWTVRQDSQVSMGEKSAGAQDQLNPNNAGGLDKDGVIMLDRIILQEGRFKGRTKERLANVEPAIVNILENGASH
ncbi:MAG TPA: NAD(P)H-dependent oxidoreductase subunit E [Candidatus Baltobacteraceae bacterium]|jgi:NADH-quinone oxidoreductase E subunit|nr:NAD(P)H-dependent oxidoreductase subunit E [Candidatus Baltobacteraceae bacterium]